MQSYRELLKHPDSKKKQMAYFKAFPNTWMEYIVTYQFDPDDKEGRKNLYFAGHKHVYAFQYKLNLIPDSLYYKKLVNIAIGGRIDADAANYIKDRHPEDAQIMKDAFKYFYNGVNFFSVSYLNAE